ncbi:hypothetical protein MASR1M31_23040 [Porphyromonadaceae bacterium]
MKNRRDFIKKSLAGMVLLSIPSVVKAGIDQTTVTYQKSALKENKFNIGFAGFTFARFDLEKSLETIKKVDVHYLCIKDFHLPFNSTAEQIAAFHEKCASYGVKGYAVGPIYMRSEEEIDRAFDYAKRVGVKVIVGVPNYDLIPYVDKMVKQYDMVYAIHNHGPDGAPFPDATDVWDRVKDFDKRIGLCFDIGHNLRFGKDPVADFEKYHSRVFDIHIKDVTGTDKSGRAIELGRGLIDWPKFIHALRKHGYSGVCSLEYEKDMDNPFMGIAESIGYFKAVMQLV